MRKPVIAGNWKMHKTYDEAIQFVRDIQGEIPSNDKMETVICAPTLFLKGMIDVAKNSPLSIGAENMYYEKEGAFTGETSPLALREIGVDFVIIGHSERRQLFQETDIDVNKKVHAAFSHHLTPIICCGETLDERQKNRTEEVVKRQVEQALANLDNNDVKKVIIAYEPVWAIGTGHSSSPEEANIVCQFIRRVIADKFSEATAQAVRIQYGGSVKPDNIERFMDQSDIDGALVGGASLDSHSFLTIAEAGLK